jgi:hypothetical protein
MRHRTTAAVVEGRLRAIETQLAGTLRPVRPPQGVVQRLRSRIRIPDRSEITSRLQDYQTLVLVLGSVLTGALVLITLARALYHVVGRREIG